MARKTGNRTQAEKQKGAEKLKASEKMKDALLEAALPDAAFDGWNDALLERARQGLRFPEEDVREVLPDGACGLARHFSDWADRAALKKLSRGRLETLRVRDKITLGVRTRLEVLAPHKQAVAAALTFLGLPPRSLGLPKMVWRTADALWRAAGDASTDYNHYTKRLLLSGVLTSTTLYWLNDTSAGSARTWEFLDRRIEEVLKIGQRISSFKKTPGKARGETTKKGPKQERAGRNSGVKRRKA